MASLSLFFICQVRIVSQDGCEDQMRQCMQTCCIVLKVLDKASCYYYDISGQGRKYRGPGARPQGEELEGMLPPEKPHTTGSITPRPNKSQGLRSPGWSHRRQHTHTEHPSTEQPTQHSSKGKQKRCRADPSATAPGEIFCFVRRWGVILHLGKQTQLFN